MRWRKGQGTSAKHVWKRKPVPKHVAMGYPQPSLCPPASGSGPSGMSRYVRGSLLQDGQQHRLREVPRLTGHTSLTTSLTVRVLGQYEANPQFSETLVWGRP